MVDEDMPELSQPMSDLRPALERHEHFVAAKQVRQETRPGGESVVGGGSGRMDLLLGRHDAYPGVT